MNLPTGSQTSKCKQSISSHMIPCHSLNDTDFVTKKKESNVARNKKVDSYTSKCNPVDISTLSGTKNTFPNRDHEREFRSNTSVSINKIFSPMTGKYDCLSEIKLKSTPLQSRKMHKAGIHSNNSTNSLINQQESNSLDGSTRGISSENYNTINCIIADDISSTTLFDFNDKSSSTILDAEPSSKLEYDHSMDTIVKKSKFLRLEEEKALNGIPLALNRFLSLSEYSITQQLLGCMLKVR